MISSSSCVQPVLPTGIFVAAAATGGGNNQGTSILLGVLDLSLRLLTPTTDTDDNVETRRNFKYNPDASSLFDVFPEYQSALPLQAAPLKLNGTCFKDITVFASDNSDGSVLVKINLDQSDSLLCTEAMIVATDSQYFVKNFLIG